MGNMYFTVVAPIAIDSPLDFPFLVMAIASRLPPFNLLLSRLHVHDNSLITYRIVYTRQKPTHYVITVHTVFPCETKCHCCFRYSQRYVSMHTQKKACARTIRIRMALRVGTVCSTNPVSRSSDFAYYLHDRS